MTKIPSHLRRILKAAKNHNLTLDATAFHPNLLRSAPIWFHAGATQALNCLNNHHDARCLRRNHRIISVGDVTTLASSMFNNDHRQSNFCQCPTCVHIQSTYDCMQPTKCITFAKDLLRCLPAKWLPSENVTEVAENEVVNPAPQGESYVFRANLISSTYLEEAFHIIRPDRTSHPLPARHGAPADPPHPLTEIEVFCCSTSIINEDGNYITGGGVWFSANNARNISFRPTSNENTSTTTGTLGTMLLLLQRTAPDTHLKIHLNDENII